MILIGWHHALCQIIVLVRILLVARQIISVDQTLDSLFDVRWLDGKLELGDHLGDQLIMQ